MAMDRKMIFSLGWRNIWRNRRRTILGMGIMAFSTAMLFLLTTVMDGFHEQIIQSSVNTYTGYIQIHRKGFWGNESLSGFMEHPARIITELQALPHVVAVSSRILSNSLICHEDESIGCLLIGVDPEEEKKVTIFHRGLLRGEGRFLEARDQYATVPDLLAANHIKDFVKLAARLQEALDPLSAYLKSQFAPDALELLDRYDTISTAAESETVAILQQKVIETLNRTLSGPVFYEPARFAHVELSETTRRLLGQKPDPYEMKHLNRRLLEEAYPEEIFRIYAIVIGKEMAKRLAVGLRDQLTIVLQDLSGSVEAAILQIVGIFDINPEFNKNVAMIPSQIAGKIVGYGTNKTSEIVLKLKYDVYLDETVQEIRSKLQQWSAFDENTKRSVLLTADDIKDSAALADRLQYALSPISQYIQGLLSANTRELLAKYDGITAISPALSQGILNDLNRIIHQLSLATSLPQTDRELKLTIPEVLKRYPERDQQPRVNRLILEAIYAGLIEPMDSGFTTLERLEDEFIKDAYVQSKPGIELEKEFETLSWRTILADVVQFISLEDGMIGIIGTVVFLAVFIIIFNVVTMSVMERQREFGIIQAIGFLPNQVMYLVISESIIMATLSLLIGCGVGIFASLYLQLFPIKIELFVSILKSGLLQPEIKPIFTAKCLLPLLVVVATGIVAPLLPAWKISRMVPVDAIRSV